MNVLEPIDRAKPARNWTEPYREGLKRKLKYIANDTERAVDYVRVLMRSGVDVTDELKELETTANGLLLVAMLLKRERNNG